MPKTQTARELEAATIPAAEVRPSGSSTTVVTGGSGFLGSHVCDRLIAEGHEVICLDSLLTGRLVNIKHLLGHPRFTFICHDVTKPIDLRKLLANAGWAQDDLGFPAFKLDFVLHMASPASPRHYAQFPIPSLTVGSLGTYHVLGMARRHGGVVLLASTSEVYGDPAVSPQTEKYWGNVNPIGPRSVYDEAKRYAEALAVAYSRERGVPVRIARIFNTYGERMRLDDGRALPNFMAQALQDEPVTVYGNGGQTRSFCYVEDLVEGLYLLLRSEVNEPVNLGNPEEITLLELAEMVIRETGSDSQIVYQPLPIDDPTRRQPDITRARTLLDWRPRVSLRDGLRRVAPYFKSELQNIASPYRPVLQVECRSGDHPHRVLDRA